MTCIKHKRPSEYTGVGRKFKVKVGLKFRFGNPKSEFNPPFDLNIPFEVYFDILKSASTSFDAICLTGFAKTLG